MKFKSLMAWGMKLLQNSGCSTPEAAVRSCQQGGQLGEESLGQGCTESLMMLCAHVKAAFATDILGGGKDKIQ